MWKLLRRIKNTRALIKVLNGMDTGQLILRRLGEVGLEVKEAQRLHASVYAQRKFIASEDIGNDGRIHVQADPYQLHSYYFGVHMDRDGKQHIVATARQIQCNPKKMWDSFHMMSKADIYPSWRRKILQRYDPSEVVEISGLAKHRPITSVAPLMLYKAMWHRSIEEDHKLWLMAIDVKLYERLKILFDGAIKKIGKTTHYQGGDVVPAIVYPEKGISALVMSTLKSRFMQRRIRLNVLAFLLDDLPTKYINKTDKRALKRNGVIVEGVQ